MRTSKKWERQLFVILALSVIFATNISLLLEGTLPADKLGFHALINLLAGIVISYSVYKPLNLRRLG